ncbi:MAG: PH domain-containing protein [Planctomycetota bacterium]
MSEDSPQPENHAEPPIPVEPEPAPQAAPEEHPDRAQQAGYPPDSGPEQDVVFVKRAMFRAAPLRFSGLVIVVLAAIVGGIWLAIDGRPIVAYIAGGLGVVALLYAGWWKVMTFASSLKITNKRTQHRRGLFSKSTSEVLHDNIRNVQVEQSFWQRIFDVGTLGLSSSGQDEIEILMKDVPKPHEVARVIDLYRPLG